MLREKTLVVVGAGASQEFGLPLGWELKEQIGKLFQYRPDQRILKWVGDAIELHARKEKRDPAELYGKARQLFLALPLAPSIDAYIEAQAHDPDIAFLGKLGIAACLLDSERSSPLHRTAVQRDLDYASLSGSWLGKLFQILAEGVRRERITDLFSDICFVVFNYDRCIQQFLVHATATYFNVAAEVATNLVQSCNIIHPYGWLGVLEGWNGYPGAPYLQFGGSSGDGPHNAAALVHAVGNLKTYSEYVEDQQLVAANKKSVEDCRVAMFLGFAFHQQNVRLLERHKPREVFQVIATAKGISLPGHTIVRRDITRCMTQKPPSLADEEHGLFNGTCSDFIDEYRLPLSKR